MKQISILLIVALLLTVFASCTIGKYEEESKIENVSSSLAESKTEVSSGNDASDEYSWIELSIPDEPSEDTSSEDLTPPPQEEDMYPHCKNDAYIRRMGVYRYYQNLVEAPYIIGQLTDWNDVMDYYGQILREEELKVVEKYGYDRYTEPLATLFILDDKLPILRIIEHFGITKEAFIEQNNKNIEYLISHPENESIDLYTDEEIEALYSGDEALIKETFRLPLSIMYKGVVYTHLYLYDEKVITHDELLKMKDEVDLIGYLEEVKKYLEPYEKDGYSRRDNYEKVGQLIDWLNGVTDEFPDEPLWSY